MQPRFNRPRVKAYKHRELSFWGAFEQLFYELKPLVYFVFTLTFIRSEIAGNLFIKFGLVGIGGFALYIMFSRLSYRGYI